MKTARLNNDDVYLRARRKLLDMPSAEMLAKGRLFFEQQARECYSLARKFPEMLPAAQKFERWSKLPDVELADHWPLARAEALRRIAVRAEMRSTQEEHGRCSACS